MLFACSPADAFIAPPSAWRRWQRAGLAGVLGVLGVVGLLGLAGQQAAAAAAEDGWQQPSAAIRAVLDAPALPQPELAPDQATLALVTLRRDPALAELARPVLGLAGRRIDPASSGPARTPEIEALSLRALAAGSPERRVELPAGGGFHALRWSPDGRHFLLRRRSDQGTELWVGDTATARLRPVPGLRLNGVLSSDVAWLGADELVVLAVPDARGPAPLPGVPAGPVVQQASGRAAPERTLQNLLKNAHDAALFSHHAQSVLRRVQLSAQAGGAWGASRELGAPALYSQLSAAGSAGLLLVESLQPPFSYQVTASDFAREVALLDAEGRLVQRLGRVALKEAVPTGGVVTGPRSYWASPWADAAVYWVEALDGGDPQRAAPHRDRLLRLDPPYTGAAREVHRAVGRLSNLAFLQTPGQATATETERDRQWLTVQLLALDGSAPARVLSSRSSRDRYGDPGQPLATVLPNGRSVLRVAAAAEAGAACPAGCLWLVGDGAGPAGERPFLDRLDLASGASTRLLRSPEGRYERALAVLQARPGAEALQVLTRSESASEPPNLLLRSGAGLAQVRALTAWADPAPQLRSLRRTLVKFKRDDGVELSFWQVLPPDWQPGQQRPTLVWAYPLEFSDADTAGQVSGSPHRFVSVGPTSPLLLALDGIVVLMDATMPVVGDPKTVNDRFVEQISANARAIVQQAVALGASDARRMVLAGHSYGAFMTANLLAHTDLFAAGIARSGAYNRSLTPFGFQSERRSYWQAQGVYQRLSPFNYADRIKAPLLLMHGEEDDNPGTFPLQSQRLFQALAGTGGTARYVSLPFEGHGYAARETVGHVLREMSDWTWRHAGPDAAGPAADPAAGPAAAAAPQASSRSGER